MRRLELKSFNAKPILKTSGSWVLLHEMYRKDPAYRTKIESILFNPDIFPGEIFDNHEIRETWKDFISGDLDVFHEVKALIAYGSLQMLIPTYGIPS